MDKSTDRLANMEKQQKKMHNNKPFTRISAISGSDISPKKLAKYTTKWYNLFGNKNTVGCFLSHRKTWKTMIKNGDTHALIMEDDCVLVDSFQQIINDTITELNNVEPDWDFLYGGYFGAAKNTKDYTLLQSMIKLVVPKIQKRISTEYTIHSFVPESPIGLHCYIISNSCARRLLQYMTKIDTHVDVMFLKYANLFKIHASAKQIGYQYATGYNSTISNTGDKPRNKILAFLDSFKDEYNMSYLFYLKYPLLYINQTPVSTLNLLAVCITLYGVRAIGGPSIRAPEK